MNTTFIIPVFGKPGLLLICLSSLRKHIQDATVIVVDDEGPDQAEIQNVCEIYHAKYIRKQNGGFASTVNAGIAASETPYVCLVNSDIEFNKNSEGMEERIENIFEGKPEVVVIGGLLFYPNNQIEHGGGYYHYFGVKHYGEHKYPWDAKLCLIPAYRFFVTGALFAIRKDFWNEYQFDEKKYINDSEDADFCLEAWKRGKLVYYDPEITAIHAKSQTLNDENQLKDAPQRWAKRMESHKNFVEKLMSSPIEEIEEKINRMNKELHPGLPIAFVRTEALGDVLRTLEVYRKLPPRVVITSSPDVFRDEKTLGLTVNHEEYAVSAFEDLDLTYERRPTLSIEESYKKFLGFEFEGNNPIDLKTNELDWLHMRHSISRNWNVPYIVIHARGKNKNRSLTYDFWRKLIEKILMTWYEVIIIGGNGDYVFEGDGVYNAVGKTNLHMMRTLLERASLFIGMDSGPMHVADGACPAVGIFTIADPDKRVSKAVTPVVAAVPCAGCLHRQKPPLTDFTCEHPVGDKLRYCCLNAVSVDDVLEKGMRIVRLKK